MYIKINISKLTELCLWDCQDNNKGWDDYVNNDFYDDKYKKNGDSFRDFERWTKSLEEEEMKAKEINKSNRPFTKTKSKWNAQWSEITGSFQWWVLMDFKTNLGDKTDLNTCLN
jgi:hypothetical protein